MQTSVAVSYTHLDVYKRQDVWTQIWQAVTIDGKSADEAINEYYPALEKAFNEANGN